MDRRSKSDRRQGDRRKRQEPVETERRSGQDRRQGERRRSINQYDMTADELEFVNAINRFREAASNRFPTARDILRILRELGYEKRPGP